MLFDEVPDTISAESRQGAGDDEGQAGEWTVCDLEKT